MIPVNNDLAVTGYDLMKELYRYMHGGSEENHEEPE
jgi:hypothetical protein